MFFSHIKIRAMLAVAGLLLVLSSCELGELEFWKEKSPVIAEVEGSSLTLEMLKEMGNNTPNTKAEWASLVEHWINSEVMYKEALNKKLQKDPAVKKLIKDSERKILIDRLRLTADNTANIENDNEMQNYYENNRELFRIESDSADSYIPFSEVKNQIRSAVLSEKRLAKEKVWLNELKNSYSIEVYPSYLDSL